MIRALVFSGYGINCERETAFAVNQAGGSAEIVHLGTFLQGNLDFSKAQFLLFPGGFSFGDELGSAKALANRCGAIKESLFRFVEKGGCILGVCNGFQLLVKLGLLPKFPDQAVSLVHNDTGRFEARWVRHRVLPSHCVFTQGIDSLFLPIRHGEGKCIAKDEVLEGLVQSGQVPLQYDPNPNGSARDIAAITDPTGRILGMMAHPEAAFLPTHHPSWTRQKDHARRTEGKLPNGDGFCLFTNAIRYLESRS